MAKKQPVQIARFRKEVESIAVDLRKRAARAAAQLEKYVHSLRKELEGPPAKRAKKAVRRAMKKVAPALD